MRIVTTGYIDALGMTLLEGTDLPASAGPDEPLLQSEPDVQRTRHDAAVSLSCVGRQRNFYAAL